MVLSQVDTTLRIFDIDYIMGYDSITTCNGVAKIRLFEVSHLSCIEMTPPTLELKFGNLNASSDNIKLIEVR